VAALHRHFVDVHERCSVMKASVTMDDDSASRMTVSRVRRPSDAEALYSAADGEANDSIGGSDGSAGSNGVTASKKSKASEAVVKQ